MKNKNALSAMLKNVVIIFSGVAIMASVSSCKKDSNNTADTVSEEESAEAITEAVIPASGGMVEQATDASVVAQSLAHPCGTSFDSSISKTNTAGAAISYSINLRWNWIMTCESPAKFQFNFTGHTTYDAPRMSSDDNSTASFEITGLEPSATAYVLNHQYVRQGTQQSKILRRYSFTSTITLTSSDINIDKATHKILSGTAAASISGSSSSGRSFTRGGTITFLGNNAATLTMQSGKTYQIQW